MADLKISNPKVVGKLKLPAETASKALQISATGEVETSVVSTTELGHLSGVTSAIQTQIGNKADSSALTTHTGDTNNPHSVTKTQVGLGNVDNTSDINKPVSTAQQTALNLKADLASPTFTGTVSGITKSMVGLSNVDNTSDASKPVSTAQQTALNLKADLASPTFTGTVSGITSAMVGLGNVDNTSDANKPVSSAQQTALNLKADLASPTFTGTVSGITASMVGLSNVDNTSDANKPVSTAQATAIGLKLDASQKGAANGVATLDANSLIPITQLPPAAIERLVVVADQAARYALTITTVQNGDTVKQTDTGLMYFVKDDANLNGAAGYEVYTAGTASSVAWSGVTGTPTTLSGYGITDYAAAAKAAAVSDSITNGILDVAPSQNAVYDALALKADLASPTFTGTVSGITKSMVGLGNVDNTSDASKPVSTAQQTALNLKADLASPTFTGTVSGITATMVGLGSVDNVQQLPMSYLDTDNTLAANSDAKVASQKAIKAYVAAQIGASAHSGDIAHTSFSAANNQVAAANVTGLAFAAGSVRSFKAQVSVALDATTPLNEAFEFIGIQTAAGFTMSQSSVGDDSGIVFSITSAGQIQYTSSSAPGFVSNKISFRATVTDV